MISTLHIPPVAAQQHYREIKFYSIVKGKKVNFCVLKNVDTVPVFSKVTSAAVIPFVEKNTMVATLLERGLDIPGGHVENSDSGIIQTIKREAYEEARISLADPLYLIGVISSDYRGKKPEQTTFMLITAGRVNGMDDFVAEFESIDRKTVTTEEFLNSYKAGSQDMMREIILRARGLSDELFV